MRQNCKSKIIESATYEFATRAYDTVTVRDIADRVQVCPPTIYIYFTDKRDLLRAAMSAPMKMFDHVLKTKNGSDLKTTLTGIMEAAVLNRYGIRLLMNTEEVRRKYVQLLAGRIVADRRYAGRKKTAWIAADTAFTLMLDIAGEQNGHTEDVSGKAEIVAGVIGKIMDLSSAG